MSQTNQIAADQRKGLSDLAGKYLTFTLDNEDYGLEILKVREIIGIMDIAKVPQMPEYVKGVINLRGQVIPVIDLRLRFGMEQAPITEQTCIIVLEISNQNQPFQTGIIVDKVSEVLDISEDQIEPAPNFGQNVDTDFILAMAKAEDSVKILLDIDKVLLSDNLAKLAEMNQADANNQDAS